MTLLTVELKHYYNDWGNAIVKQALDLIIYYFMSLKKKLRAVAHLWI